MADSYPAQAREIFQKVEGACRRRVWNLAVRRAEKVVSIGVIPVNRFRNQEKQVCQLRKTRL